MAPWYRGGCAAAPGAVLRRLESRSVRRSHSLAVVAARAASACSRRLRSTASPTPDTGGRHGADAAPDAAIVPPAFAPKGDPAAGKEVFRERAAAAATR